MPGIGYILLFLFQIASAAALGALPRLPSTIFQFGDSLSDTGNSVIAFPNSFKRLITSPYGETFFHRPASRECDGRLIVDFLASAFGLPLLDPYLLQSPGQSDRRHGVNFAVCGASALGLSFFDEHNISLNSYSRNTFPLDVQLRWFRDFKNTSALLSSQGIGSHPSPEDFSSALYIVGEIGGNDYGFLQASGMDYDKMLQFVPFVVGAIREFIQELYNLGARNFLVINIARQGCNPISPRKSTDRLDRFGCIDAFNAVNARHNSLLRIAVDELRRRLINASISYADFYGVMGAVLERPQEYGFTETKSPCCGTPWQNWIIDCTEGQLVNGVMTTGQTCTDPSTHLYWNWAHFTEHFYNVVANAFLAGEYIDIDDNVKAAMR